MITTFLARVTSPCRDVTRLVSESMDRPLPWSTRFLLQVHFWICQACARYRDQLRTVRQALRCPATPSLDSKDESSSPSSAAKARLTEAFRAKHE